MLKLSAILLSLEKLLRIQFKILAVSLTSIILVSNKFLLHRQ